MRVFGVILLVVVLVLLIPPVLLLFLLPYAFRKQLPDLTDPKQLMGTRREPFAKEISRDILRIRSLPYTNLYVRTFDGKRLHAALFQKDADKTVILAHGYHSSGEGDFCGIFDYYLEHGFRILLVDERAHGKSDGYLITFGVREHRDLQSFIRYAAAHFPGDIWLHGASMGAASALMTLYDELPDTFRGVIADSAFNSEKDILSYNITEHLFHFPYFPFVPLSFRLMTLLAGERFLTLNAADAVRASALPVLLLHGDADHLVPLRMTDAIEASFAPGQGRRVVIPGATHVLLWYKDRDTYAAALDAFFSKTASGI